MSSDSKRYGSSFGRPSGSGAGSFGFEPAAANPLRSSASGEDGPKVYSSDAFDEAPAPRDEVASFDPNSDYQLEGEQGYEPGVDAASDPYGHDQAYEEPSSLRERIASRFSESLSFSRSKPEPANGEAGFEAQDYDAAGLDDSYQAGAGGDYGDGYGDTAYGEATYGDQAYGEQSYDSQSYSDQGYSDQGYSDKGFETSGFENAGYDSQSYDSQGYDSQGYDSQGYDSQGYGTPTSQAATGEGRPASGWRSRFANRTADLAGSDGGFHDPSLGSQSYDTGYASDYTQSYDDTQSFDSQAYNSQAYDSQGYGAQDYGSQAYASSNYDSQGYVDDLGDDTYTGQPGSGALGAGQSLISPGLNRGPFAGLSLSSKWLMPAGSIAVGVLVLAVLLYLFNPFSGNPLETPESIATVETMLAGLDIDPGPQDGIADDAYRLAIVEFQEMHGLAQTGELTPEVFEEMTAIYELSNL